MKRIRFAISCLSLFALGMFFLSSAIAQSGDDPFGGGDNPFDDNPFSDPDENPFGFPGDNPFKGDDDPFDSGDDPEDSDDLFGFPNARNAIQSRRQAVFWADGSQQESQIRSLLRKKVNRLAVEFEDAPLSEVIDFIRSQYGVPIQLDLQALDDLGLSSDDPVSIQLRDVSLNSALVTILQKLELTHIIRNDVIWITSQEEAKQHLQVAVYPIGDLVAAKPKLGRESEGKIENVDQLIDTIVARVSKKTWSKHDGQGVIASMQSGLLVIQQTDRVHSEVLYLLDSIRLNKVTAPKRQQQLSVNPHASEKSPEANALWSGDTAQAKKIRQVLHNPLGELGLEFQDTPLSEVIDFLGQEYGIRVEIDLPALDDLGLSIDDPITVNLRKIPLDSALRIMLSQLDLTYTIRDGTLLITSEDEAIGTQLAAVYQVSQLINLDKPKR